MRKKSKLPRGRTNEFNVDPESQNYFGRENRENLNGQDDS